MLPQQPFLPDTHRARTERGLGVILIISGIALGKLTISHPLYVGLAILLMLVGWTLMSVADTRLHGAPQRVSTRSTSYIFVWLVVRIRSLFQERPPS
jgi:hypothetical protein